MTESSVEELERRARRLLTRDGFHTETGSKYERPGICVELDGEFLIIALTDPSWGLVYTERPRPWNSISDGWDCHVTMGNVDAALCLLRREMALEDLSQIPRDRLP